jgi:archaellum component FlaC
MAYKKFSDFTVFDPPDVNDYLVGYRELGGEFRTTIKNITDFVAKVSIPSDPTNLYVGLSGDDTNFGNSQFSPFRTIKRAMAKALEVSRNLTPQALTIEEENGWGSFSTPVNVFVQSGTYIEDNPIYVPPNVTIVGESVKTVTVIPKNKFYDIFWVNNKTSIQNITFRDYYSPAYAVTYPEFFYLNGNIVSDYPSSRVQESTARAFTYFNQNSAIYTSTRKNNFYIFDLTNDYGDAIFDPFTIAFLARYYKDLPDNNYFFTEVEKLQNKDFWQTAYYNLLTTIQKPLVIEAPYIVQCVTRTKSLSDISDSAGGSIFVDGSKADGVLASMVIDNFDHSNEGGNGIYVTNNAYAQVNGNTSKFCLNSVKADNGGNVSLNGNSFSYGSNGLVALGKSTLPTLRGTLKNDVTGNVNKITVTNLGSDSLTARQFYPKSYQPYVGQIFSIVDTNYLRTSTGINYLTAANSNTFFVVQSASKVRPAPSPNIGWECDIVLDKPYVFSEDSSVFDFSYTTTPTKINSGSDVVFYIRSTIEASSQIFEHIGSGTDSSDSYPINGGSGNPDNEVIHDNVGIVIYNSQNKNGNFKIGDNILITQSSGSIYSNNISTDSLNSVSSFSDKSFIGALSANSVFINSLTALSATINVVDVTVYELSGFNATGNVTVKGSLSATDLIYAFGGNSNDWNSVYTSVSNVSSTWDSVYTDVSKTSANWNSVYSSVRNVSANWNSVYSSVKNVSSNWDSVYSNVNKLSSRWESAYTDVSNTSADWDSVYSSVNQVSSNWDSVYTDVSNTSADWDSVYSSVNQVSSNWDSVYSSVNQVSSTWDSVYTDVSNTSADWNSVYSSVNQVSSNWDSVYSSVNQVSSNWDSVYTDVSNTSANWNNAYDTGTVYQQNSATYATIVFTNSKFLPLSGGEINGDLSLQGNLFIAGSAAIINATELVVADNMIYLAEGNVNDSVEIGFTGAYDHISGNAKHVGLVRNHIDKKWTLFSSLTSELLSSLTIDFNDPSLSIDTLKANIEGNLTANTNVYGYLSASGVLYANGGNSKNWNSAYSNVNAASANWNSVYTDVSNISSNWNSVYNNVNGLSSNWNSVYANFNALSSNLNSVYNNVNGLSSNWDSVYNNVNSASANWNSVYSNSKELSSRWESVYSNVNATSANLNSVYNNVNSASANWNSVYNTTNILSSNWNSVYNTTNILSSNWDSVYNNVNSASANWNSVYNNSNALSSRWESVYTSVLNVSGNWDSVYNNVNAVSANINSVYNNVNALSSKWESVYTDVSNTSANWNSVYTNSKELSSRWESVYTDVSNTSANWNNAYNTGTVYQQNSATYISILSANSKFLPISGGIIDGDLSVTGSISAKNGLQIDGGGLSTSLYVESGKVGINTETPNEALTVVGSISTNSSIYAFGGNSILWNSTYSTVQSNSASWIIDSTTDSGVRALTGYWESVYNNVNGLSSNWDSVYSTVNSNSATAWNYQGTDLKNLSSQWVGGNDAYTNLVANSAAYLSGFDLSFLSVSANWNSTHFTVNSLSSNWNSVFTSTKDTSGNWDSTYTSVNSNSAKWESVYTTTYNNSATYVTTVATNTPGTSAVTSIVAVSALPASPNPNILYIVI